MFQTFISRHNSNFFSDKLVLTSVTPASAAPDLQTPKATSSPLYFDSLMVNAANGGFLQCIQLATSVNAATQVVSVDTDIAFDADPKFFACLVRFESSSVPAGAGVARGDGAAERVDLDALSAVPMAIAFAVLAVATWLVRSIPRTLALTAIASLIAIALMPLVEALRRRTGWDRRYAAALVLVVTGALVITTIVLVTVPTINQISTFNKEIPKTVDQLGQLPIIGPRLRHADA